MNQATKAPAFTSAASDTVTAGTAFTYSVTTSGTPTPAITLASGSTLPSGVTLTDNKNGTATLAGTSAVAVGVHSFTIQAANGVTPNATQAFTLTVNAATKAPAFTSAASDTVTAGSAFTFSVTTTGTPTPAITLASGSSLPKGVTLSDNKNGTATLAGTSSVAAGTYTFNIVAANGVTPNATQAFTLKVTAPSTGQVSLKFTGSLSYVNSGSLTSGGFTITPATGTITSVTGTGTIAGLKGGSATIKVDIQREPELFLGVLGKFYVGYISVDDPGAHLDTVALVFLANVTRVGSNGVSGVAYGLAPNGKTIIYQLSWTI